MVQMVEESIENFSFLMKKEILKRVLFLFVEKLFHDFKEIASQDRQGIFIFVKELSH